MPDKDDDQVKIFEPDRTLMAKVGYGNLDRLLSPQAVADAERVIAKSSDQFAEEGQASWRDVKAAFATLQKNPEQASRLLQPLIDAAFSARIKMGQGGYDLIAALAKSLQLHCESIKDKPPASRNMAIMAWHIGSIDRLLKDRVKGIGGDAGKAILAELERLSALNRG
jgi:hypothetical protein